ncbi:MAG: hypothetical protein BWZ10_02533 [candidate division BRC1 bacterium ADurb.BinA364]|nr:MAG: hypothetical protein BWZ10_02533 [candidate division BRC1 bacterium ADurb.BinA364]
MAISGAWARNAGEKANKPSAAKPPAAPASLRASLHRAKPASAPSKRHCARPRARIAPARGCSSTIRWAKPYGSPGAYPAASGEGKEKNNAGAAAQSLASGGCSGLVRKSPRSQCMRPAARWAASSTVGPASKAAAPESAQKAASKARAARFSFLSICIIERPPRQDAPVCASGDSTPFASYRAPEKPQGGCVSKPARRRRGAGGGASLCSAGGRTAAMGLRKKRLTMLL